MNYPRLFEMNEEEFNKWFAGWFDGEGCVGNYEKGNYGTSYGQAGIEGKRLLDDLNEILKINNVVSPMGNKKRTKRLSQGLKVFKESWQQAINDADKYRILKRIEPYMATKQIQAQVWIFWYETKIHHQGGTLINFTREINALLSKLKNHPDIEFDLEKIRDKWIPQISDEDLHLWNGKIETEEEEVKK